MGKNLLFFCGDNDRSVMYKNQFYSPLLDSLRELCEEKGYPCLSLASPRSKIFGKKAFGSPTSIRVKYSLFFLVSKMLVLTKTKGWNPLKYFWKKTFKKHDTRIIFSIGASVDFCQAARGLNIRHFELLHGMGYPTLPWGWKGHPKKNLPQGVICFDKTSKNTFNRLKKKVKVCFAPHFFYRKFCTENKAKKRRKSSPNLCHVLVSLQWGYDGEFPPFDGILPNGLVPLSIFEAIEKTQDDIIWYFKFHPVHIQNKDFYNHHFKLIEKVAGKNKNCDWRTPISTNLPSLFQFINIHITMSSMTCYDASYFGIPSIVLCPTVEKNKINEKLFWDLRRKKIVHKASNDPGLIIQAIKSSKKVTPPNLFCRKKIDSVIYGLTK